MRSMARGKAPGDDGLPVEFFEATWEQVGPILVRLFNRVLEGGKLTEDMCRGVITLMYKKGDKLNVRNWRPITLLNVAYKILAKALSRRVGEVLPDLVKSDQGAFVKGRSISENILVAMGALEVISKERRQVLVAMLDLEKAYDRVNWSFVLATLEHVNFGSSFRRWVGMMYRSATATVTTNERKSREFSLTRSLRHGCPLAPLLFVVQMEVVMNAVRAAPLIKGFQLYEEEVRVGAIADDLLLISEATPESMGAAKDLVDQYSSLSEAKVNWDKSVYFLPSEFDIEDDWTMRRAPVQDSERYLGVQVSLNNNRPAQDSILVAKAEARVKSCKAAMRLSLMGRARVVTTSIFSLIWHIAAVILISRTTLQKLRSVASKYLWKLTALEEEGFICKVAWDKVAQSKRDGGLSIIDPERQNLALLGKWFLKISSRAELRNWLLIMQYIMQQEFHLARKEDVWLCLQMSAFLKRRPNSAIGASWCTTWKKLRPQLPATLESKAEILRQPLFENSLITDIGGREFEVSGSPTTFWRKWIERGVSRVQDLWDDHRKDWRTERELRQVLGRMQNVGGRRDAITEAISIEWREILSRKHPKRKEAWYKEEGIGAPSMEYLRLEELTEQGIWTATRWEVEKPDAGEGKLRQIDTEGNAGIDPLQSLTEVRVCSKPQSTHGRNFILIQGGAAISELRLDPLA
ncbi:hypothetical protein CBR_g52557 [Chara braunii]|uniref:Reverse transcriptase domain-containing protein n=1 Tax=Chara braunii TaxID=69332 RepID=A0A388MAJ9_CHABU|nr:hypothetical protein CBR_g52557 [Chara braunii]|eukprot:GBG91523.1 hypothetical protein CBR_g52557 [Chara braunii]